MEAIVVAVITGTFGLVGTVLVQRRVHRENRSDHAQTVAKVDGLIGKVDTLGTTVGDVRDDVRDMRADLRDHGTRLRHLEHPPED